MNRENIQSIYPLLPNQEAFWLAHLHAGKDPGCLQATYQLDGKLDPAVFEQALNAVVLQHALLRATIQPRAGKSPLMVVWKEAPPSVKFHDLSDLPTGEQLSQMQAAKAEELSIGVRPDAPCPNRFLIFHTSGEQHELVWTFHHAFLDGWSSSVVIRDLLTQYDHIRNGRAAPPGLAKYENFVAWRKTICADEQTQFWRQQLDGYAGLPKRFGSKKTLDGAEQQTEKIELVLSSESSRQLQDFGKEHGLTAGSIAAGLWALTLSNFYQEDDVAFGSTVSGRSIAVDHVQDMAGLFSNVVPLRQKVTDSQSVVSFLKAIRDRQFAIQSHEHMPLAEVTSLTKLARDRLLFETLLVVENYPTFGTSGELKLIDFESGLSTSYPLTICVIPSRGWTIQGLFDPRTLSHATAESVVGHFSKMVELLVRSDASTVSEFREMLPAFKRHRRAAYAIPNRICSESETPGSIGNPRNDTELKLAMIWERTLGLSEVRYDDNFFEIGGSSLTATRVIAAVNSTFEKQFSASVLIEHPTIQSLAILIGGSNEDSASSVLVRFNNVQTGRPLICVNVGTEPAMFYRHLASHFPDRPVIGTQSRGLHGSGRPYESVPEAAEDFLREIDRLFSSSDGLVKASYDLVAYCAGCSVAFEMARQLESVGREVGSLTIVDSSLKYPRPDFSIAFFRKHHKSFIHWLPRYLKYRVLKIIRPIRKAAHRMVARFCPVDAIRAKYRKIMVRDKTMKAYFEYEIHEVKAPMMLVRSTDYVAKPEKDFHVELQNYSVSKELRVEIVDSHHETILFEPTVSKVAELVTSFSGMCESELVNQA